MNLTLTGDLAKHILSMTKKDSKLAQALAQQLIKTVDPSALASYLLTKDVALELLANRIRDNPESTLSALQAVPASQPARQGRPAIAAAKTAPGRRRRQRLSAQKAEQLKAAVMRFLQHHPGSTRKAISSAVSFPSLAIYNRIMGELRKANEVVSKGQKAKTVYSLKGAGARAGRTAKVTRGRARTAKRSSIQKAAQRGRAKGKGKTKSKTKPAVEKKTPAKKSPKVKKVRTKRPPLLCPYPGCGNRAAPVFGMMCRDHKDLGKEEREKLFAERRKTKES